MEAASVVSTTRMEAVPPAKVRIGYSLVKNHSLKVNVGVTALIC